MEITEGSMVDGVGVFFKVGIIEYVVGDVLTIRWRKHYTKCNINFVQKSLI